jgi:hypothetical protein
MKKQLLLSVIAIALVVAACGKKNISGNGKVTTIERKVKGYNAISVSGAYEVYLKNDTTESIVIEADENLIPIISTEVNDSVLEICNAKNIIRSEKMKLIISYKSLSSLDFSGATELTGDSGLLFNSLSINISGAGKIALNMKAENLNASISGGADMDFSGTTNNFDISITGAGNLNSTNLLAQNCKIDISGFGRGKVYAEKKLEVNISGAGKVEYKGNPSLNQSISGAGKVMRLME